MAVSDFLQFEIKLKFQDRDYCLISLHYEGDSFDSVLIKNQVDSVIGRLRRYL